MLGASPTFILAGGLIMSSSDHYHVGYKKTPVETRYSSENQPLRRKRKVPKGQGHKILTQILRALDEDVSINTNGKSSKAKLGNVFARRFVKQGVGGTFNEQLKFAGFLKSYGELDPESIRQEIEEEYAEIIKEEQRQYSELLTLFHEAAALCGDLKSNLDIIIDAFVAAKSKCSCDGFNADPVVDQLILDWSEDNDGEVTVGEGSDPSVGGGLGWAPMTGANSSSGAYAVCPGTGEGDLDGAESQDGPPADDLSAEMIGND